MRNLILVIALAAGCSSSSAPTETARSTSPTIDDGLPTKSATRALIDPSRPLSTDALRAKVDTMKLTVDQRRMLDQAFAREAARFELVRGETAMRKRAYEISKQTR